MTTYYWNDLYTAWGWILWFGMIFLFFSVVGNWGYTYRAHRLYRNGMIPGKDVLDLLNERYVKGELNREEYLRMKADISTDDIYYEKESPPKSSSPKGNPSKNSTQPLPV
jgi:putative membrane protein